MRLTCFPLLTLLPLTFSSPAPLPRPDASPDTAPAPALDTLFSKCSALVTRDHTTCACLPGFTDPGNQYKECTCPDERNSFMVYEWKGPKVQGVCQCWGAHQDYNADSHTCQCDSGYTGITNKFSILTCTRASPTPTNPTSSASTSAPTPSTRPKRDLFDNGVWGIEEMMGCKNNERGCKVSGIWSCLDVSLSLTSCGGCPDTPESTDCSSLPGVNAVSSAASIRNVSSLEYTLIPHPEGQTASCVNKQQSRSLFKMRDHA
ncbi:hypothetical protein IAT38_006956 [Cryptococcus sp. DSM 104549]